MEVPASKFEKSFLISIAWAVPGSLKLFLGSVFLVTYLVFFWIIRSGGIQSVNPFALIGVMWIPGAIALLIRAFASKGTIEFGFRRAPAWGIFTAIFVPAFLALLSYFICASFDIRRLGWPPADGLRFELISTVFILIIGALGEEIGWRGFILPKLIEAGVPRPLLVSGVIWGLWHLPLILWAGYYTSDSTYLLGLFYFASCILLAHFIGWLSLATRSIWAATAAHASHNFFFQHFFSRFGFAGNGERAHLWEVLGGDAGAVPAVLYAAVVGIGYLYLRGNGVLHFHDLKEPID